MEHHSWLFADIPSISSSASEASKAFLTTMAVIRLNKTILAMPMNNKKMMAASGMA